MSSEWSQSDDDRVIRNLQAELTAARADAARKAEALRSLLAEHLECPERSVVAERAVADVLRDSSALEWLAARERKRLKQGIEAVKAVAHKSGMEFAAVRALEMEPDTCRTTEDRENCTAPVCMALVALKAALTPKRRR